MATINGSNGADTIFGTLNDDRINAGNGKDTVFAGSGNDVIDGGNGADVLFGEGGDDTIIGGNGGDRLSGGAGSDTFVFNSAVESGTLDFDTITDFSLGRDKIDLRQILGTAVDLSWGNQTATVNGVWYQQDGANSMILADTNSDGVADLKVQLNGLHALSVADFLGVSGGATNIAPVNTIPGPQSIGEDETFVFGGANAISVADADSANLTVTLSSSNGALTLAQTTGLNFTLGDGNSDGSMTFTGSAASINAALNGLSFRGTPNFNGTATIQITTSDGSASDTDEVAISIAAVNDAPVNNGLAAFTTNEDTPAFINGLSVSDVDAAGGGQIQVTLGVSPGTGTLSVTGIGSTGVSFNNLGSSFTLQGTLAQINAALGTLNAVRFTPAADFFGSSTLTMTTSDQGVSGLGGTLTDSDSVSITVAPVNDAPTGTDMTLALTEDTPRILALADFGFDDVENDAFAAVALTTLPSRGTLTLNGTALGAGALVAAADIAAGALVYTPALNVNGGDNFTFQVQDDGGTANGGVQLDPSPNTLSLAIAAVNDAPVNNGLAAFTTNEDTPAFINGLSVSDVDAAGGGQIQVTLGVSPGTGTLSVTGIGSTGVSFNNLGSSFTLQGTLAQINAALGTLNAVRFTPAADFFGSSTLTMTTSDQGVSGLGGTLTDSDSVSITVAPVNDAPTGTDMTLALTEDTPRILALADFGFDDVENDAFAAVALTTLPSRGTLTLNGTALGAGALVAAADIAAGALVYTPALNVNGGDNFTFQVQDDGGTANGGVQLDPSPNTLSLAIAAVNDAPVNNGLAAFTTNEDTPAFINGLSVSDVDAAGGGQIQVTLGVSPGTGTLSVTGIGSTGVSFNNLGSSFTLQGTLAQINAALGTLNAVRFTPAADFFGSSTLTMTTSDQGVSGLGGTLTDSDSVSITVAPVNDAPTGTDMTLALTEDTPRILALADFGFDDVENDAFAAVALTTLPSRGTLTLNGTALGAGALVAAADIAAGALVYTPALNVNGGDNFTFQVQDDGGTANGGVQLDPSPNTLSLAIAAVNDAPVNNGLAAFTTNEDTPAFINGLSVSDVDAAGGGQIQVTLGVSPGTGTLSVTGIGSTGVSFNNLGSSFTLQGTLAQINAALGTLNAVRFTPAADFFGSSTLTMTTSDQGVSGLGGTLTDSDSVSITVAPVNDAPTGTDMTLALTEDTPRILALADFGFDDVENDAFAAVALTTLPSRGTLTLNGTALGAGALVAAADIAAGALVYTPALNVNGGDNFTFQVQDDGGTANGGVQLDPSPNTLSLAIAAVNDAPVNNGLAAFTTNEDTPAFINGLSVSDVDAAGGGQIQVTLGVSPGTGTLSVTGIGSTGVSFNNLGSSFTLQGTLAQINAALGTLNAVRFTPAADFFGSSTLTMTTSDQGVSGLGGTLTDSDSVSITVAPVNDAPTGTDMTLALTEDTPRILALADFGFDDVENDAFAAVALTTLPSRGTLTLNGTALGAGALVAAADIAAGALVYTPALNVNGGDNFTFQVQDDGGTANGGVQLDPSPNTLSFSISAVNDAAVITSESPNGFAGLVVEDGAVAGISTTSGNLFATDIDNPDDSWQEVTPSVLTASGFGRYQVNSVGAWTYTLDNANSTVNALGAGQTLMDSFIVNTIDGTSATVNITINGANDSSPPLALDDQIYSRDAVAAIPEWALLQNDSDLDGDSIDVSSAAVLSGGGDTVAHAAGIGPEGTVTFTDVGANGGSFSYQIIDSFGVESLGSAISSVQRDIAGSLDAGVAGGRTGDQILVGGASADDIFGGDGNDILLGGGGADRYHFDLDDGTDHIWDSSTSISNSEIVQFDTGTTSAISAISAERFGADLKLTVELTSVTLLDPAFGSPEVLRFNQAVGSPPLLFHGYDLAATQNYRIQSDLLGDTGADLIASTSAGETLDGVGGNDLLFGNAGADTLNGGAGADLLVGGSEMDTLNGDADNDVLVGDSGDDRLNGGTGRDILTGGEGTDTFEFSSVLDSASSTTGDLIVDFERINDKIDLSGIDANSTTGANDAFSPALLTNLLEAFTLPGQIRFGYSSATNETIVQANVDANFSTVDFEIHLIGNYTLPGATLSPFDFVL